MADERSATPGRVDAIWIKRSFGGVMDPALEVSLVAGKGIETDASFGRSNRQVTVIEKEAFDRIRRAYPDAEPAMRRANFMVSGVRLADSRKRVLKLGGVRILLRGETTPCERMDEQCPGLRAALTEGWSGGAHGIVLDDGLVRVGDSAVLEEPAASDAAAGAER
ncbi:MAG: sulfurase [Gemmatimonadetes bacterium]|nr:sulfurase [Gemmatimonadota bacterium]